MSQNQNESKKTSWSVMLPLAFALVMAIGMFIGFKFYNNFQTKPTQNLFNTSYGSTGVVSEVFNFIESRYVDTVNQQYLQEEIIKQTLERLDPHSTFIPSSEISAVNESMEGNFDGIGIQFSVVKDTILVISPISGGPSERLGILAGDKIVEIEDSIVAGIGMTSTQVMEMLKGKKNTEVRLGIKRGSSNDLLKFTIKREKIPLYSMDTGYMLDNEIGYIKLNRFSATTVKEFGLKVLDMQKEGMKKLILDLRGNPGGYLDAATEISDELIGGKQLMVFTEGVNYKKVEYYSRAPGLFEEGELAILLDEGSASASEVVAGAIQDLHRGVIVGRRSFGKGLVQEQHRLSDGSALRLTVARYYTPSGRSVQKPYSEDLDQYYNEVGDRYESGEIYDADSIANSDSSYTTPSGTIVKSGGGIIPDIYVPLDTTNQSLEYLIARSHIPNFVYNHFSSKQDYYLSLKELKQFKATFTVGDEMMSAFKAYLSSEKIEWSNQTTPVQTAQIKTMIKAFLARQIWQNEGYYVMLEDDDRILNEAIKTLKNENLYAEALKPKL